MAEKIDFRGDVCHSLMQYLPGIAIQGYRTDGIVFYWNKESERIYGYTAEEAIGKDLGELIIPVGVLPEFRKVLELGKKAGSSGELMPAGDYTLRHKDGHLVPVYSIHTVIKVAGGEPLLFCIDVDLSERQKAERVLTESEEKYRDLCDNIEDLFQSVGIDGSFTYVNKAWLETLGYDKEEVLRLSFLDVIHPDCHVHCMEIFNRLMSGKEVEKFETTFLAKDGRSIILEGRANCCFREGKPVSTRAIFRDITERKKMETSLREREEEYRLLFEDAADPIIVVDADGNFEKINKEFEKETGYKRSEMTGRNIFTFGMFTADSRAKLLFFFKQLLAGEELEMVEVEVVRKDGTKILYELRAMPVRKGDRIMSVQALFRDITDRKMTQEKLEEYATRLQRTNKDLDDFSYVISHDLKAPLVNIERFADFLQEDCGAKLGDKGNHYLERLRMNAQRMQRLIGSILEFSRVDRNGILLEEVASSELVDEAELRLEFLIARSNAQVTVKGDMPKISCDPEILVGVFTNLISNAIKYNDKKVPVIEIGCGDTGSFYEFYVKDNGPGIEKKRFEEIFKAFHKMSYKEGQEGSGVGLAIVKKIIEKHGGTVRMESVQGQGTTFYFTIPRKEL